MRKGVKRTTAFSCCADLLASANLHRCIQLRTANGTQKEHREIAFLCANEIKEIFPFISIYLV